MLLRLLTLPLSAPIAGIRYCLEKVAEVAEKEMWDEEPVREQLILENQAYEEGQIDEATFRVREAELLVRLREIKEHRRKLARADDTRHSCCTHTRNTRASDVSERS